ncbi:MAG: GGDEF domain-containing protein [Lachnospiraceae bacterium]|nr:GGDEF domain-containing protein [Lachnospiraceae bacterium]
MDTEYYVDEGLLSKEQKEQEKHANSRTMYGLYGLVAVIGLCWLMTVGGLFDVDRKAIDTVMIVSLVLTVVPIIAGHITKMEPPWYKYLCLMCLCVACSIAFLELSFHVVLLYAIPIIFACQYKNRFVLWFTYALDVVLMTAASVIGFSMGICDLNVLFKSNYRLDYYLGPDGGFQNIVFNDDPVFVLVFYAGFPRALFLLLIVVMQQFITEKSRNDAVRIAQLQKESDTDLATNTYNKGKYEEMIRDYYPKAGKVAVIFWDLNGLKFINDTRGHDVGDAYIEKLADTIRMISDDKRRKTFRVGGDEFIMIIEKPEDGEPESLMEYVRKSLDLETLRGMSISAASGFAVGEGSNIEEVVKKADETMYDNKRKSKKERKN